MTTPQTENGYTKIANEIIEALAKIRISGEEMQCLWVIIRQTYGWNKKSDCISFSQFSERTGLSKPSVSRAIKKLLTKKIIAIDKNVNRIANLYSFNKHLQEWKPLTKKITPLTILSEGIDNIDNLPIDKNVKYKRQSLQKKSLQKKTTEEFVLPDWINKEAWDGYVEMRKENKKPLKTLRAMNLAVNTLEKLKEQGHDPNAVLDKSTEFSWQGLFALNSNNKNNGNGDNRFAGIDKAGEIIKQRIKEAEDESDRLGQV